MLKSVGIIAEYNPFHNGHKYQIDMAKKQTNADLAVVIMSGNWVQRGQPAILDKWTRAQMALKNGADMVIELPIKSAVQPADIFAKHAVNILTELGCNYLSFGSENPNLDFDSLKDLKLDDSNNFKDYSKSYPELIQELIKKKTGQVIDQPNDILALNYYIANRNNNNAMKLVPIKRIESQHHAKELNENSQYTSASSIRSKLINNDLDEISHYIPNMLSDDQLDNVVTWDDFWPLLKYKIITTDVDELSQIYQMSEGLQYRLKKYIVKADSFEEFLDLIKTKRYTYPRLQRLLVYTLLNWKTNDSASKEYVRILGFNKLGRSYLKPVKDNLSIPLVAKVNKNLSENELKLDVTAGRLYGNVHSQEQDFGKVPIIYNF